MPGWPKKQRPQDGWVVRCRGLPFAISKQEIAAFFSESELEGAVDECIQFTYDESGRPSGMCYVVFADVASFDNAQAKHKEYILSANNSRYVEVFRSNWGEMERALKDAGANRLHYGQKDQPMVKIRGLPFSATEEVVRVFFNGLEVEEVKIARKDDGEATGEAFIKFTSQDDTTAALQRNYHKLGMSNRYIEVFKCTEYEFQSASTKHLNFTLPEQTDPGNKYGSFRVTLRGIPWKASEGDIIKFFAPTMPSMVEIQQLEDGRAKGTATAWFHNEEDTKTAMMKDKELMGTRYIDLFDDSDVVAALSDDPMTRAMKIIAQAHGMEQQPQNHQVYQDPVLHQVYQNQEVAHPGYGVEGAGGEVAPTVPVPVERVHLMSGAVQARETESRKRRNAVDSMMPRRAPRDDTWGEGPPWARKKPRIDPSKPLLLPHLNTGAMLPTSQLPAGPQSAGYPPAMGYQGTGGYQDYGASYHGYPASQQGYQYQASGHGYHGYTDSGAGYHYEEQQGYYPGGNQEGGFALHPSRS